MSDIAWFRDDSHFVFHDNQIGVQLAVLLSICEQLEKNSMIRLIFCTGNTFIGEYLHSFFVPK